MSFDFKDADVKLKRAEAQAAELANDIADFFHIDNKAHRIATYRHKNGREFRCFLERLKPFDEMWPVRIGEIVHNLRSALDYLVYEASSLDAAGKHLRGTEYPIFKDEELYRSRKPGGGLYKIRGLSPETQAFIETTQPFMVKIPPNQHEFWLLHEFANADKHRMLNLAETYIVRGQYSWTFPEAWGVKGDDIEEMANVGEVVDGGIELMRLAFRRPMPFDHELTVNADLSFTVVFDDTTPFPDVAVSDALDAIGRKVGHVIAGFRYYNP